MHRDRTVLLDRVMLLDRERVTARVQGQKMDQGQGVVLDREQGRAEERPGRNWTDVEQRSRN